MLERQRHKRKVRVNKYGACDKVLVSEDDKSQLLTSFIISLKVAL